MSLQQLFVVLRSDLISNGDVCKPVDSIVRHHELWLARLWKWAQLTSIEFRCCGEDYSKSRRCKRDTEYKMNHRDERNRKINESQEEVRGKNTILMLSSEGCAANFMFGHRATASRE